MTDSRSTVENILEYLEVFITEKQLKKTTRVMSQGFRNQIEALIGHSL